MDLATSERKPALIGGCLIENTWIPKLISQIEEEKYKACGLESKDKDKARGCS